MNFSSIGKALPLLAALAATAACDTAPDADTDGCECSSTDDSYCVDEYYAMECTDGCHLTAFDCDDPHYDVWGCSEGECWAEDYDGDPDDPECWDVFDNECIDGSTLLECQVFASVWDNYYAEVNCADPALCPGDAGCGIDDAGVAACWCDETDGGVSDAGTDGGE